MIFVFVCVILNGDFLIFLARGYNKLSCGNLQVFCLDVGQASSTVVIFPNGHSMIVDTGSVSSCDDFLGQVNAIFLYNNIKQVDFLVLTHSDEDHVGGTAELLKKYQVKNVYRPKLSSTSSLEKATNFPLIETYIYEKAVTAIYSEPDCTVNLNENKTLMIDSARVMFQTAKKVQNEEPNYHSPFILITQNKKNFLLCGDAEEDRELEFLEYLDTSNLEISVDFLIVGHHGSNMSSCQAFLERIKPKNAIISAKDDDFPALDTIIRLKNSGVSEIYITKQDGTVGVSFDEDGKFLVNISTIKFDVPLFIVAIFCLFAMIFHFYWLSNRPFDKKKYINSLNFKNIIENEQ